MLLLWAGRDLSCRLPSATRGGKRQQAGHRRQRDVATSHLWAALPYIRRRGNIASASLVAGTHCWSQEWYEALENLDLSESSGSKNLPLQVV